MVSALPVTVAAGTAVQITVQGFDPADGSLSVSDTLTCTYTDTDSLPDTVNWPITLTVQTVAIPTLSTWGMILPMF